MSKLSLVFYPTPLLRQKASAPKNRSTVEWQKLLSDMEETMNANNGIGLAAPQIGLSERIAIIKTDKGIVTLVDPFIAHSSLLKESGEEGCLSIPGVFGLVKRSKRIKIKALDRQFKPIQLSASGFFARVIQHEIDHLNGVLFIDRAHKITQGNDQLKKYEKK